MQHKIFKTLLAVVIATMTFYTEADIEIVDGIKWTYTVKNGKASVGGENYPRAIPQSTSGAITIPSILGGYPVTSIGDRAFCDCKSLTSVTIPKSVWRIGHVAFCGCSSLTSVTIPDSVASVGTAAFLGCSSLTRVTIPNSVTSIGDSVFRGCRELTIYTDAGNAHRIRKMLDDGNYPRRLFREMYDEIPDANIKGIIEQGPNEPKTKGQQAEEQKPYGFLCGFVLGCASAFVIFGGLFFWIVRRKNKREGASEKTDSFVN